MRRFEAPSIPAPGERVVLDAEVSHHLLHVTLVPRGRHVLLFAQGQEVEAELVDVQDGLAVLEGRGPARAVLPSRRLILVAGLARRPAWERTLRMGTELGVTEFRPFVARHSVAKGDKVQRWAKICSEAARQCGRAEPPQVLEPQPLARLLEDLPARRLLMHPGAQGQEPEAGDLAVLIGPEGGLHRDEVDLAVEHGFKLAGLGDWVLRSDTAAAAALARYSLS